MKAEKGDAMKDKLLAACIVAILTACVMLSCSCSHLPDDWELPDGTVTEDDAP